MLLICDSCGPEAHQWLNDDFPEQVVAEAVERGRRPGLRIILKNVKIHLWRASPWKAGSRGGLLVERNSRT
jgi:hypothetical protein